MNVRTIQRSGYTLVEMLVTLVILGIAAAMLVPSLGAFGAIETQAAVRRLVSDIAFAQSEAVAHQRCSRALVRVQVTDARAAKVDCDRRERRS